MLLIETRFGGVLFKKHWHAVCKTKDEAMNKIQWMEKVFGGEYTHSSREITPDEIPEFRVSVFSPKTRKGIEYRAWEYEGGIPK